MNGALPRIARLVVTLAASVWAFCPIRAVPGQTIAVVSPRGPLPSVVTTDRKSDRDAAADLCAYLCRVSGREICVSAMPADQGVIIHVGRDAFVRERVPEIEKLFADGYTLKCVVSDGRYHLVLAGRMAQSSQWAVEQFLRDYCGVRWIFPDPVYGEVVPSRPTVAIDRRLAETYEPDYVSRANCGMYYFSPGRTYLRLRPFGYDYGQHAIQFMFSTEEFAQHPEWFALFGGKRQWWKYGNGWQICTTNPHTVEHAVNCVLDHSRRQPDAPVVSVGQNDGAGWCECRECTEFVNSFDPPYTLTERWFDWVNQVARRVAEVHPDKWIEAMAYGSTSKPPRFELESNVAITKTIVHEWELRQAEEWKKVCKSVNLYSYTYGSSFLGFRHYPHAMRDFLKWGHEELGALAHVTECGGDWTFDGPKYHYMQALQWDVNADPDEIMDDFCEHSYGAAARPMRDFWDRLEQVYERRGPKQRLLFYQWVSWQTAIYVQPNDEFKHYTIEDVGFLDKCMAEAARLAANDGEAVQFRLARISDAWKYFRTMLVSYLVYLRTALGREVTSEQAKEASLTMAREIADLRAERRFYLGKLRSYRDLNPRMRKPYYWSLGVALTLFSHERTLLDEVCTSVSRYVQSRSGAGTALKLWQGIPAADALYGSAQTQIHLLTHPKLPNLIANGGFEAGSLNGWQTSGDQIDVVGADGRRGKYAARTRGPGVDVISQKVSVSPGQRYRLTAWGRYLTKPPDWAVPLEAVMEFYGGTKRVWCEPTRCTVRTTSPTDGWAALRSTLTVPPGANSVVIKLKKTFNSGTTLWDDVALERIRESPKTEPGAIADTFDGERLDAGKWFQATCSGGTKPPRLADGWLIYDDENMYPLTSYATFDDLLRYRGKERYRLRTHVAALPASLGPSSVSWGVKASTGPMSISDSGMFWTHHFGTPKSPKARLLTYAYQGSVRTHIGAHMPNHSEKHRRQIWYTFYFDPEYVTAYAASGGYGDREGLLVARYKHGITDIAADGPVYLKIGRGSYMLDEISLVRPELTVTKTQRQ